MTASAAVALSATAANAEAALLVDVDSGRVLYAENATVPWYPASVTKVMTAYVILKAVKDGRITMDKPLVVSENASAQQPAKMGFQPGTVVTVENALKMMMVKSANDMAVVLAEGLSGSIENFATEMNRTAAQLGMTQTSYVNPNGLPADGQITSARDLAILARAAIRDMPEYGLYWHIPAIKFGRRVMRNYNTLIDRYPGADGMKTGFICASGFNLVATATRDNKRLIAVVLGAPSSAGRAIHAAQLLERGFAPDQLAWLSPSLGTVESLTPVNAEPPNMRDDMCGKHRKKQASEDEDDSAAIASLLSSSGSYSVFLSALRAPAANNKQALLQQEARLGEPVPVHLGPPKKLAIGADAKGGKAKGAIATATTAGPELASRSDDGSVPLPRPRPKIVRATTVPGAAASSTATTTTAAHAAPRPAAKPDPKTDAKKK